MLTVTRSRAEDQLEAIKAEKRMVDVADSLLDGREARIFPPDRFSKKWQIFVRHSTITTEAEDTFAGALYDLIRQLSGAN